MTCPDGRRRPRRHAFTLVEVMVASSLGLALVAFVSGFLVYAGGWIKRNQMQGLFTLRARYGTQTLFRTVQNARSVSVSADGLMVYLLTADDSLNAIYYRDADATPETITDNGIWYDPNPDEEVTGDEELIIPYVTPLAGFPVFAAQGPNLLARFHVGDPAAVSAADRLSGKGYQGIQVRTCVQPRNIGRTWASAL